MEISKTANYSKLVVKGMASENVCAIQWEEIVRTNDIENNSNGYSNYFDAYQSYGLLCAEYNIVKACLNKLMLNKNNIKVILELGGMGYAIDNSSEENFNLTFDKVNAQSNNLTTKIKTKLATLELYTKGGKAASAASLIAQVSAGMSFKIPNDILLAEFNEYKKIIKSRSKKAA